MRATEDPWHADIGMEMETLHDGKTPCASCTLLRESLRKRRDSNDNRCCCRVFTDIVPLKPIIGDLSAVVVWSRQRKTTKTRRLEREMRVRNIDQDPDSLHQRIIADDDLGFTQAIIAQRQGCAQSTVSQVLAAERLRRLRAELGKDADGADGPETSVRAVHAAEQVREALAYVRAVEKRLMAVQRLLVADVAADATRNTQNLHRHYRR